MILKYISFALAIFIIFRAIPLSLHKINISDKTRRHINIILPVLEFLLWILLIYKIINYYFSDKTYFSIIIIGIIIISIIIISFFILKDFTAGLILRTEYGLSKGVNISTKDFSGKIIKTSYLNAEILTDKQEIIKVPYSKINGEIIKIPIEGDLLNKYEFEIKYSNKNSIDESKKIIYNKILIKPWIIPTKKPEIIFIKTDENIHYFKIYLFCLNEEHARLAMENI